MFRFLVSMLGGVVFLLEAQLAMAQDRRTPTTPPIRKDSPPRKCVVPPDDVSILRWMPPPPRGIPGVYEISWTDIDIVRELVVNRITKPSECPFVGLIQEHRVHWKCTVYYTERVDFAVPFRRHVSRPKCQVIYINNDHLHLCDEKNAKPSADRSIPRPPGAP